MLLSLHCPDLKPCKIHLRNKRYEGIQVLCVEQHEPFPFQEEEPEVISITLIRQPSFTLSQQTQNNKYSESTGGGIFLDPNMYLAAQVTMISENRMGQRKANLSFKT